MTSWRKETFAALEGVAERGRERWPLYAEFARLQSRGLRKQGLIALSPFVEALAAGDWTARWAFASWLYGTAVGPWVVLSVLAPHPLQQRVLVPTLKETQSRDPSAPGSVSVVGAAPCP